MQILKYAFGLECLYPYNLASQEVINKFHFTLLRIMFIWLIVITLAFLYLWDDIMTRRALIDAQYEKDQSAYIKRTERYKVLLDNAEKKAGITKERQSNGANKR